MLIEFNANCIHSPMSSMPIEKQSMVTIKEAIKDFRFRNYFRGIIYTHINKLFEMLCSNMMNKRPYLFNMA